MKKIIGMFAVLVLVSCSDQYMVEGVTEDTAVIPPVSEIDVLKEKARWGDGEACLKLADCYRDGIGVKADFPPVMSWNSFLIGSRMRTIGKQFKDLWILKGVILCSADRRLRLLHNRRTHLRCS